MLQAETGGFDNIDAFIFSGYPHAAAGDLFARHVLPRIDHAPRDIG